MATSSSDGGNNGNASNAAGGISGTGQNMSSSISATSPSTTTDNNSALPDGANNTGGASSALSSSNGGGENGDNNSSPNGPTPDGADDSTAQPSSVPDGATSTANGGDGSASQSEGPNEQISEQEYFAGTSKFIQVNKHLLGSDLMRSILATLHFLYEQSKLQKANPSPPPGAGAVPGATIAVGGAANAINTAATAAATANPAAAPSPSDEFVPWDHIYPKGKDGLPLYNISGKYIVKLYWMGQWRKITVDDKIPVDANGRPLLISSPFAHEVWPLILCKALVKVASTSYKEHDGISEQGDFDVLNTLRGWLPERFVLNAHKPSASLWNSLCQLNLKNLNPGAAAAASAAANSAGGISNLNASIGNTLTVAGGGAGGGNAASVLFANATSAAAGDAASAGGSGAGGVATAGSGATMTATYNSAAAPGATPSSQIMAKRGNLPSSRGGETLSNLSQTGPYVVALAYRDGDDVVEKIDFSSIPIYFRVVDIREGAITQSVSQQQPPPPGTQSKEWDSNSTVQRLVKLRTYFSGG